MGALGAQAPSSPPSPPSSSDFSFFVTFAQNAFRQNGRVSKETLCVRMETCLWVGALFDARAERVWSTMGLCDGADEGVWGEGSGVWEEVASDGVDDEYALGESTANRFFGKK